MMRIKNEEEWIAAALEAASPLVDGFVILDDSSTDRTPELCRTFPKVIRYEKQTEVGMDEVRDKNQLLQWALDEHPDWILALDGDEVLEDVAPTVIKREIAECPAEVSVFVLNFLYMWDSHDRYRVDGHYQNVRHQRLFRVNGLGIDPRSLSFLKTGHGGNFHGGSVPANLPGLARFIDVNVKHYGYFEPHHRLAKRLFYEQKDPRNAARGYYDHLTDEKGSVFALWRERDLSEVSYSTGAGDISITLLRKQSEASLVSRLWYVFGHRLRSLVRRHL